MADHSRIEWTESTWNPLAGCEHVSPGCDHCYAAREASERLREHAAYRGLAAGGRFTGEVRLLPHRLDQPLRWRKPRMVFVNSMSDLFHKDVPDEYIARVFAVMALARQHTFQVLTKRHARMRALISDPEFRSTVGEIIGALQDATPQGRWSPSENAWGGRWPLPNVWLGVSVEDQQWYDIRVPALLDTPAAVRFLSCEPLLGLVHLGMCDWRPAYMGDYPGVHNPLTGEWWPCEAGNYAREYEGRIEDCPRIDWVIAGGESGPDARPMHPAWARSLRDECTDAGVPFFFKQFGEFLPVPVIDAPHMSGGRAFRTPAGLQAAVIRERSPGAFRPGETRLMQPGDRNGHGVMLDPDTIALRVGKKAAGRILDGRTWDQYPGRELAAVS